MSQQHDRLRVAAEKLVALVLANKTISPETRDELKNIANCIAIESEIALKIEMQSYKIPRQTQTTTITPGLRWWSVWRAKA
jgi:hypothetical protein